MENNYSFINSKQLIRELAFAVKDSYKAVCEICDAYGEEREKGLALYHIMFEEVLKEINSETFDLTDCSHLN